MQDPNPLPWGAQDRYQAHFIVKKSVDNDLDYSAKTILTTSGHFGLKKIKNIQWSGGKLAESLNDDAELNKKISAQTVKDGAIFVDPSDNGIRIYGKWKDRYNFTITKEMYEIFDKIASHIKKL